MGKKLFQGRNRLMFSLEGMQMFQYLKKIIIRSKPSQSIDSGDNSINAQANRDVVIHHQTGLTITQAKELYDVLFKENFVKLQSEAMQVAEHRAQELIDQYLLKLNEINPELLKNANDPDIQYVVYEAQKAHARRGNKELASLLVDLL